MIRRTIRLLFFPREQFPTDRVRINALFGVELLGRRHEIDLVMQAANERVAPGAQTWHGRTVWVGPTDTGNGFVHRLRKHWRALRHDLRSLSLAQPARYDTVLVSDKFIVAAIAMHLAHARGLKFIFWLTFPVPEAQLLRARLRTARYPWAAAIRGRITGWILYRRILPRCDHLFVQSEQMKRDVCARGIDPRKVSTILTGVDLRAIGCVARPAPTSQADLVTLGYLGTLSSDRHLDVLVEMLALLRHDGLNARLLFVGDADAPKDRGLLEKRAADLGLLQHMEITGFLPQQLALARVAAADICLSPFHPTPILQSTSPTKLVEYLALGRPVVANDHPEQRAILGESRAGVCVPWGSRYFARGVQWLMRRPAGERAAMGARGRAWIEANRTYARIADDFERGYLLCQTGNAMPGDVAGAQVSDNTGGSD